MIATQGLQRVTRKFQSLRTGIRSLFLVDGLSVVVLLACAYLAITYVLDFVFNLPQQVRIVFLVLGSAGLAWMVWRRVIRPFTIRITDDDLALFVERHHPELNDRLISALQLSRMTPDASASSIGFNSPELVENLVQETDQLAGTIEFKRMLLVGKVGQRAAWAIGTAAAIIALAVLCPRYVGTYGKRVIGMKTSWLHSQMNLQVLDFENNRKVIERGQEKFTVRVKADAQTSHEGVGDKALRPVVRLRNRVADWFAGRGAEEVQLIYKYENGEARDEQMASSVENCYDYTFERVAGPFSFVVKGGDDETERHYVDTLTPPNIEWLSLWLEYPSYLRMENTPENNPVRVGHVSAPIHTKVKIRARANQPVREGWLAIGPKGREKLQPLSVEGGREVTGEFLVADAYSEYEIRFIAENTLPNREALRYTIHGIEDKKPEFRFVDPMVESEDVSEICNRPLVFETRDDHGIREIQIEYQVRGDRSTEWRKLVVTPEMFGKKDDGEKQKPGDKVILVTTELDFTKIELPGPDNQTVKIKPGDHVYVRFRAADFKEIGGANVETSREIHFSVKSVAEIERALQEEIDRIKRVLFEQRKKQEDEYRRADGLLRKFSSTEALSPEQQREIRDAKLEQNSIVDRLETTRKDIARVMRRGVYNRVFNDTAAAKLQGAVDILTELVGDPNRREKYGAALSAVQSLEEAGSARERKARDEAFGAAKGFQLDTSRGIQRALDMLEKWANYQEVIRVTREILELVKRMNQSMQK